MQKLTNKSIMIKNNRSKTVVIKEPSEMVIGFFNQVKADKAKRKEELLKKDKCTFTVQV